MQVLDFPLLVNGGAAVLESELGVSSRLHQQQILRGLKRVILGLGRPPSPPQSLHCATANRSAVKLAWDAPVEAGHPPMHKYQLQRQALLRGQAVGKWHDVGEPDDEDASWVDAPPAKGAYRFRLAAWSAYGRSDWVVSNECKTVAVQKQRRGQQQQRHVEWSTAPLPPQEDNRSGGSWSWPTLGSLVVLLASVVLKVAQLRPISGAWARSEHGGGPGGSTEASEALLSRARDDDGNGAGGPAMQQRPCTDDDPAAAPRPLRRVSNSPRTSRASLPELGEAAAAAGTSPDRTPRRLVVRGSTEGAPHTGGGHLSARGSEVDLASLAATGEEEAEVAAAVARRARCAHPGCDKRFDRLRDFKVALQVRGLARVGLGASVVYACARAHLFLCSIAYC
jgi:hypothetical protein